MVRTKRKLLEYNDFLADSCQLFQLGEEELRVMVNECQEKIKEIVNKRPRKIKCLKALNRTEFDVNLAVDDFMDRTFETDSEVDEVELKNDTENHPKATPAPKRRRLSEPFKVQVVNINQTPSRTVHKRAATPSIKKHFQQEDGDVSAIWFDKFMTQRKTPVSSRKEGSATDITGLLNLSADDCGQLGVDRNAVFACKFSAKASWMLKNCFETIRKIHGGKLTFQMCKIKVRRAVPEEIVFTVVAQPGRKSEVITVLFKRPTKFGCFSFSKWSSTFKNEVQIGVSAVKIRDILKELKKQQNFGILIENDRGLKRCFMMIIGQSRKIKFKINVLGMEASPELANFDPPEESQTGIFDFEEGNSLVLEGNEDRAAMPEEPAGDILAWIKFNHVSLKKDIASLKAFGTIGELHIVKLQAKEEHDGGDANENYWAEFRTESSGTEATIPMSKDTVHNIEVHIRKNCEEEVLGRPVKLSLQILSNILSLKNIPTVKMDIHKYQGVGMFFKFARTYGQGQVNYYFNQIDPRNVQLQPKSQEISVERKDIDSYGSFA